MRTRLAGLISGWFGCGYAPVAPGTVGSAAAVLIAMLLRHFLNWPAWSFGVLGMAVLLPAIWAAGVTGRQLGREDPSFVVVDEVVGQWLALAGAAVLNWKTWLAAFVLFRVFDIWKPPPVRQLESLPGGCGILMDDVMAGAYASLVLFLAGCFNLY